MVLSRSALDDLVPPSPARMPLSAPRWVWALYVLVVFVFAILATRGGFFAFSMVFFTMMVSFQFWTFVAHRGVRRRGDELTAPPSSSSSSSSSSSEGWDA